MDINIILPMDPYHHHPINRSKTSYQWMDRNHHHPINRSILSYQWIIKETSSSYRWSTNTPMDKHQHHPINESITFYEWSINIILPMDQHNPTNGSSINEESLSYQCKINMILSMDHQRRIIVLWIEHQICLTNGASSFYYLAALSYQWMIIILPMVHHLSIDKAFSSTSYQVIIYCIKIDGGWRQNIYPKKHLLNTVKHIASLFKLLFFLTSLLHSL